jgi:predicted DNA-binding protein YlxM (UPF0122 family)
LLDLYEQSWSINKIADHFGASRQTVGRRIGALRRPPSETAKATMTTEEVADLYQQESSLAEIAEKAGVSYGTVQELGRHLLSTEAVDHRNGDKSDNRPGNPRVFASNGEHLRVTRTGRQKMSPEERERPRREAAQRAHTRVEAIRAASRNGADQSP